MRNCFVDGRLLAMLFALSIASTTSNAADIKQVRWHFTLTEGAGGDAGFSQKKTVCVPTENGFITRLPANGDPVFTDDLMQDSEHISHLDVADVAPPQSETCLFHFEKHKPSDGPRCVDFWIDKGPRGATVCEGQWALRALIEK